MANTTIYPFGTNGQLPSSIGVINDLITGGADKALSAEMGKELNETISGEKSLGSLDSYIVTGIISEVGQSAGTWTIYETYYSYIIPVVAGNTYRIKAKSDQNAMYAVLTSNVVTNKEAAPFSYGYSAPVEISAGASADVRIASNGSYLYVKGETSADHTPQLIAELVDTSIDEKIDSAFGVRINGGTEVTLPSPIAAFIATTTNRWVLRYNNYSCVLLPVLENDRYRLTANATQKTYYAVLADDAADMNTTPNYATGYSAPVQIDASSSAELTIPEGGNVLYIATYIQSDATPEVLLLTNETSFEELIQETIQNDLVIGGTDKSLSAEMGKELNDRLSYMQVTLPSPIAAFIATTTNRWVLRYNNYSCVLLPVESGKKYRLQGGANGAIYAVLQTNTYDSGTTPDYATGYAECITLNANTSAEFTIPADGNYIYVAIQGSVDYTPTNVVKAFEGNVLDNAMDLIDEYAFQNSHIPTSLTLGEPTNIIYTIDDFLMAHEYDENNNIDRFKFSNDLGETWTDPVTNIWGTLVNIFMFADGTLFFAGYKDDEGSRCYWTRDFETFTECTVIDYDGSTYVPVAGAMRFGEIQAKTNHVYVNGTEYYCCGDYIISSSHPRIWYAISGADGVTVRAAFCFGYDEIDGVVIPARHYHSFDYNPYDGKFYALTGDNDTTECNILRGTHDANHVWTWERVAYGPKYKLASITFDAGNMYAITDYTSASLRSEKGVLSVPINDINENRFRYWFKPTEAFMLEGSYYGSNNPAALSASVLDNHGWRIIGLDYAGNSKMLIAKGGHNYSWVDNDAGVKLKGWIGPNNKGDIYVWWYTPGFSVSGDDWVKFSHRTTYNFTEIMRNSGATDFFEGYVGTPR